MDSLAQELDFSSYGTNLNDAQRSDSFSSLDWIDFGVYEEASNDLKDAEESGLLPGMECMEFLDAIEDAEPNAIDPDVLFANPTLNSPNPEPTARMCFDPECSSLRRDIERIERIVKLLIASQHAAASWSVANFTQERMKELETNLVHYLQKVDWNASSINHLSCMQESRGRRRTMQTDESDISEEDSNRRLDGIFHEMQSLRRDGTRQFWAIPGLRLCDRRHIHALAHFLGLSHISIGDGKTILLSTRTDIPTFWLKKAIRRLRLCDSRSLFSDILKPMSTDRFRAAKSTVDVASGSSSGASCMANDHSPPIRFGQSTATLQETEHNEYFSSYTSSDSAASYDSVASSLKRKRQSRHQGGFICYHDGCYEKFDRRCDLTQHERSHLPYEQRPYGCESCEKRFLFPKDLRRHEGTHTSTQEDGDVVTPYDTDEALAKIPLKSAYTERTHRRMYL